MPESMNLFLGFDPGGAGKGKGNFGWSICREVGGQLERVETGRAREAWDARSQVKEALKRCNGQGIPHVMAAGIDAPLFWTKTAIREVDAFIKQKSDIRPQPINSLYGAAIAQGPLLAKHLRGVWGDLKITESYPRALEHLLGQGGHPKELRMVQRLTDGLNANPGQNHERDATLCAVAAWAAIHPQLDNWQDLYRREPEPITLFDIPVSYWMPIAAQS